MWDARQAGRPALQLLQPAAGSAAAAGAGLGLAAPAPAITCLDVHPTQHFCCATGGDDGGVAVWDLRAASSSGAGGSAAAASPGTAAAAAAAQKAAVTCCSVGGGGPGDVPAAVCDVRFEGAGGIGSGSRRLVFCTAGGAIGVLREAAAGAAPRLLFREPAAAVRACCLGAAGPCSQLFSVTDQEGLVYMANAL